jgi:threonine dehydrogenase-like Zn-dependent dehydrogenase
MRAAQLVEPKRIEVVDAPTPEPGEGEVRVKVAGCGVCASNVPPFEGREWFEYPMTPGDLGHEAWGIVDAIGRDAGGLVEGDRVAMLSYKAYAEYDVVAAGNVVKLPEVIGEMPFPAEPLACAINIFKRSNVRPGDHVVIVGVGFLGALLAGLAKQAGASVIATTRRADALEHAAKVGAKTVVMDDHEAALSRTRDHLPEAGADVVIECAGKQWPLDFASELVREHGRLVIAGYHQDGPRQVNLQQWNWKGLDVVNAHERNPQTYVDGMHEAVEAAAAGRLQFVPLLTHELPLEKLGEALQMNIDRPTGFLKAYVTP